MTEEQKQRIRAVHFARAYKTLGYSSKKFLSRIKDQDLPEKELEDCLALDARGELEHLVAFVWTWKR